MIWILLAGLCSVIVLLIALYRRALHDTHHMFSLLIFVLLDDSVFTTRKGDLVNFVRGTKAKDANQLSQRGTEVLAPVSSSWI